MKLQAEQQTVQAVTFLLQSQLSLGLDVLQSGSQVPGQTASTVGRQQRALLGHREQREQPN